MKKKNNNGYDEGLSIYVKICVMFCLLCVGLSFMIKAVTYSVTSQDFIEVLKQWINSYQTIKC